MSSIRRRVEQLEQRSPTESNQLKVVMGYIQHLPAEYQGPRHLVVRDQLPWNGVGDGLYEWEECGGEGPAGDKESASTLLIEFVSADGPYRLGDARRKCEAEAHPGGVIQ